MGHSNKAQNQFKKQNFVAMSPKITPTGLDLVQPTPKMFHRAQI